MRKTLLVLTAAFFIAIGFLHLVRPAPFVKIVPPFLPHPLIMVYLSGVAEMAGGVGLLIRPLRRAAAWGLVVLLIAVFPANIYMAIDRVQVTVTPLPIWTLWARLPLQFLLIWWVLWCSRGRERRSQPIAL